MHAGWLRPPIQEGRPPGRAQGAQRSAQPVVRVVIADCQEIFRHGLRAVFHADRSLEVVGEARDGAEAVALARELCPHVVLLDVELPVLKGIDAAAQIVQALPGVGVLMLASSEHESDFYDAVKVGARGYLLKASSGEEVASAVRALALGESPLAPSMTTKLLTEFTSLSRRADGPAKRPPSQALSRREVEVLRLLARGMTNREVAGELFISENTVKNHVRNILDKLQLKSRMLAVMYAVQERLIEPDALY